MTTNQKYALGVALEATTIMVDDCKMRNLMRSAAHYCREAQTLRRQLREA